MRTKSNSIQLFMLLITLLAYFLAPAKAQDAHIVLSAQSLQNAQIVLPQNATNGYITFAALLQKRLQQSLGQNIAQVAEDKAAANVVLFHIGPTKACLSAVPEQKSLPLHTYIVRSDGKSNIYFAGPAEFTVGFAVVEFADKVLNIRQYMPAPLGECITKSQSVTVPAEIKAPKPDLASVYFSGLRNRFQGYDFPYKEMEMALQLYQTDQFQHNFFEIFPAEKYAQTHPEYYYASEDGKRHVPSNKRDPIGLKSGWQPCLTNSDVLKITIDYCIEWFKTRPDATSVSIAVNDGGGWCRCDACKAEEKRLGKPGTSNLYYDFANKVARAINKEMPGKMVGFIAYGGSASLPPTFPIEKNVLVYKVHPEEKEGLIPWAKLGASTGVYTWLYGMGYVTPRYFPHEFKEYLKKWEDQGAKGFVAEAYPNWIVDAPMLYAVSKIARNINVNIDSLLEQYAKDMYGPAASDIIEFYQTNERAMSRRHQQPYMQDDFNYMSNCTRPLKYQFMCWRIEDVTQMDKALEKGAAKLTPNTIEAQRMNMLREWWSYSRLFILAYKKADMVAELSINSADDAQKTGPLIVDTIDSINQIEELWVSKFRDLDKDPELLQYYRGHAHTPGFEQLCLNWIEPKVWPNFAIDNAMQKATENLVKKLGSKKTAAIWQNLAQKYPKAESIFLSHKTLAEGNLVNIVENSSFEKLDSFEKLNRTPLGFRWWYSSGSSSDIGMDEKIAHSGKRSWTMGQGTGSAWISKTVTVMSNARYLVSVWVRKAHPEKDARMNIIISEVASGNKMVRNIPHVVPTDIPANTWVKHEIIVTVPEYCDKMTIDIAGKNYMDEGDRVWYDDLSVSRLY